MNKFYGIYAGVCVDNVDPQGRSRIRMRIPQLLGGAVTNWADACLPVGGTTPPEPDTPVWAMFIGGDPNFPIWVGVSQ